MDKKHKSISYAKWGYIFKIPFLIVFITCQLIPLFNTFYNSFFENYRDGLAQIGPNFVGFDNYIKLFTPNKSGSINIVNYACNTMIMWIIGAIPQLVFSLLLAVIFTSARLNIKGQTFFKTVIYMPNLVMASAFSMLFFTLFSNVGPINQIILAMTNNTFEFFRNPVSTRCIIAFINFLMWFGNTTILLMAGIMGIDQSLFEAASIDGATSGQVFFKITLPLLMPILLYVAITSLIGGLQMFDVPQIITAGSGSPNNSCMTLIMYLNRLIGSGSKNYGMGGAVSVVIFILTGALSMIVFKTMVTRDDKPKKKAKKVKEAVKNG